MHVVTALLLLLQRHCCLREKGVLQESPCDCCLPGLLCLLSLQIQQCKKSLVTSIIHGNIMQYQAGYLYDYLYTLCLRVSDLDIEYACMACRRLWTGACLGSAGPLMPRPTWAPSWPLPKRLCLGWRSCTSTASCMGTWQEVRPSPDIDVLSGIVPGRIHLTPCTWLLVCPASARTCRDKNKLETLLTGTVTLHCNQLKHGEPCLQAMCC